MHPPLSQMVFGQVTASFLAIWPESADHMRTIDAPESDLVSLRDPQTRNILNQTVQDAMRGGAQGALQDLILYTRDWGIPFDRIRSPIQIWHGLEDGTVPVSHTHWYEAHLPHIKSRLIPGEGHFSLPLRHASVILHALLAR